MKSIHAAVAATALIAAGTPSLVADTLTAELVLEVSGIAPSEGALMIAVFDSAEAWNGGEPVAGMRAVVEGESLSVSMGELPAGTYGVKMYHDVNGNGELDTNLMGIPSEPFAFSNNAVGRFGPPNWTAAQFDYAPGAEPHAIRFD